MRKITMTIMALVFTASLFAQVNRMPLKNALYDRANQVTTIDQSVENGKEPEIFNPKDVVFGSRAWTTTYTFSQSTGTYTEITGGTVLGDEASDDQRFVDPSVPLGGTATTGPGFPIGFDFEFDGVIFDRFALNTNGWISFGQSALTPSVNINTSSNYNPISATSTATPTYLRSRIAPFGRDLQGQTGSEIMFLTEGTAPWRVLTIQWKNFRRYNATGESFNFQIKLYETTNVIELIYGTITAGTTATCQVGISASTNADYHNRTTTTDWTATTAGTVNSATCTFSSTIFPPSGLKFTYSPPPPPANDLGVISWLAPANNSDINPADTVKIRIKNFGTNPKSNFPVKYSIDGGNTFVTEIYTGTLAAFATMDYTFNTTANMGLYKTYSCIANIDTTGDENKTNNTLAVNITKAQPTITINCGPQLLPLWSGTVNSTSIVDSSFIRIECVDVSNGWIKFDLSSIPANALVTNVELHTYVQLDNYAYFRVMQLENDPVTATPADLFEDIKNGTQYYEYAANFPDPGWFVQDLGPAAVNHVNAQLAQGWFGVGLWEYEASGSYFLEFHGWNEANKPYIAVKYVQPLNIDASVIAINEPSTGYNPSNQVIATIKNVGTNPITQVPVSYILNGDTVNEITPVGDTIYYGQEYQYTFAQTINLTNPGAYNIEVYVSYPGDINPGNDAITKAFTKWEEFYPLVFDMDITGLTASYGPQFQNGKFYISCWNQPQVYVLAPDTSYIAPVTVLAAGSGFRDLGGDGDSLFGSTNNTTLRAAIEQNDTVKVINSMTVATAARGVDYDPHNDAVWICNWNAGTEDLRLVNRNTGALIQTLPNPNATLYGIGGLAYDYWTPGGPYLIGYSQHNNKNQLVWIRIADGTVVVDHDVTQDIPDALAAGAVSGGAYLTKELVPGKVHFGGVIQNFSLFGYEMITTDVVTFNLQNQVSSSIDANNKFITVYMPYGSSLSNVITNWTLSNDSAKVMVNGVIVNSGDAFDYVNNDTADFKVVYYNVFGTDSVYSDWKLVVRLADAPVVTTDAATNIDMNTATLNGTIDPNNNMFTSIFFEYGLTTAYGNYGTPSVTTATGNDPIPFAANIAGLTANTTYHYRIVGVLNTNDTIEGNDMNFTTLNLPAPVFTTTAATNINFTTADVNGTVDANSNLVTNISFLIGTSTGVYSDTVAATPNTLSADTAVAVSAALTGLTSNTTYYYRVYGLLGASVYTGDELSFTTLNATLTVAPATQNVTTAAGTVDFTVTANQPWTATSDQTWCTVTPSGTGNGTITATYTENTGFTARTATITVTGGVAGTQTVTVVQAGVVATLAVTPATQNVGATAGTVDFTVTSNQGWTAASNQTWCTVTPSGTGNGTITATYTANAGASPRTATITVTGAASGTQTVTVVQAAGVVLAEIYSNGPFITNPGAGAGGANVSALQTGMGTLGFGVNGAAGYRISDNADLHNDTTYVVKQIKFFGYQTITSNPNPTTSTFTGVNFKVWNGDPMNGGTVVYDYSTNNMMTSTTWSGVYRTSGTALTNTDRSIMEIVATLPATDSLVLPGTGDYWIDWALTGSAASGPWANPITIVGQTTTGNAIQWNGTAWSAISDGTAGTPQGMPFKFYGRKVYTPAPTPVLNVTPASLAFGNQTVGTTSAAQTYTLTGSNLTANVTITAPTGFQVSLDGTTFAATQTVAPTAGNVNQTVHVRFAPTAAIAYSGNVANASTGATTANVAVSGMGQVGITELGTINVSIYPNPVKEKLFVNAGERIESVRVMNLLGETVYTAKVNDVTTEINTSTFAEGSYVIMVISNNGQAMRKFQVVK